MNYLWILAFCLCGALAIPITEDETQPEEMASELDIVEERDDELVDKIEDEGEEEIMGRKLEGIHCVQEVFDPLALYDIK